MASEVETQLKSDELQTLVAIDHGQAAGEDHVMPRLGAAVVRHRQGDKQMLVAAKLRQARRDALSDRLCIEWEHHLGYNADKYACMQFLEEKEALSGISEHQMPDSPFKPNCQVTWLD